MSHTLNISLIVRLTTNTSASDTAYGLATLLRSSSKTKHALNSLHDEVVIEWVMGLREVENVTVR
jgi:hypothetical protein